MLSDYVSVNSDMEVKDDDDIITLNISGTKFEISQHLFARHPTTKLGSEEKLERHFNKRKGEYFFDHCPAMFTLIVDFYRKGALHFPANVCPRRFKEEIDFWQIPEEAVSPCCWMAYKGACNELDDLKTFSEDSAPDLYLDWPQDTPRRRMQYRVWMFLDDPYSSTYAKIYATISLLVILMSVVVLCLETMEMFENDLEFHHLMDAFEVEEGEEWEFVKKEGFFQEYVRHLWKPYAEKFNDKYSRQPEIGVDDFVESYKIFATFYADTDPMVYVQAYGDYLLVHPLSVPDQLAQAYGTYRSVSEKIQSEDSAITLPEHFVAHFGEVFSVMKDLNGVDFGTAYAKAEYVAGDMRYFTEVYVYYRSDPISRQYPVDKMLKYLKDYSQADQSGNAPPAAWGDEQDEGAPPFGDAPPVVGDPHPVTDLPLESRTGEPYDYDPYHDDAPRRKRHANVLDNNILLGDRFEGYNQVRTISKGAKALEKAALEQHDREKRNAGGAQVASGKSNVTSTNGTHHSHGGRYFDINAATSKSRLHLPHPTLLDFDLACMVFFTVELLVRFAFCLSKVKFLKSLMNIFDIFSVLPYFLELIVRAVDPMQAYRRGVVDLLYAFRVLRIFRVFRLGRHYGSLRVLLYTIQVSVKEMVLMIVFLVIGMLIFSVMVYYADLSLATFHSVPHAFWWAIVTMTTVGYGDLTPKSNLGYLVGSLAAVSGVLLIAFTLPVIVNNFLLFYQFSRVSTPTKDTGPVQSNRVSPTCSREDVEAQHEVKENKSVMPVNNA